MQLAVVEVVYGPFAAGNRLQDHRIRLAPRIEGTVPAAAADDWPADWPRESARRRIGGHGGEGREVTIIGGAGDVSAAGQIGHAFAQRTPALQAVRLAFGRAIYAEGFGVVHGGLDPQHLAVLVVNLDRVAAGVVFQAHALGSVLETCLHLSFIQAMNLTVRRHRAAEETQHFRAAAVLDAVLDQWWVNRGERGGRLEHQISRILALIDAPIIRESQRPAQFRGERVALAQQFFHRPDQRRSRLRVGQPLRAHQIVDRDERVVTLYIADASVVHLPCEPEPAVEADGDLEREPRLHAQVHETELGMLEIEVVMQALAWPQFEVELVRRAVAPNEVGQARIDDVEEPNQTFAHAVAFGERAGEFFLIQRRRV